MRTKAIVMTGLALGLCWTSEARAGGGQLFDLYNAAFNVQACNGGGCWTNHLRVTDLDADGDLDIVFANYDGFFSLGSPQELAVYQNNGTGTFTNVSNMAVGDFSGRIRQVAIGDIDGDGDLDMFAPDGANGAGGATDAMFINDGTGVFIDEADVRIGGIASRAGATRFGDVDDDGDLDLFIADGYAQGNAASAYGHIYINDGTGVFEELDGAVPQQFEGVDIDDVDWMDADRDWDLDLFVNAHAGQSELWLNDGTGVFTLAAGVIPGGTNNFHYNPGVCDVDGDGDLDIWIDNIGGNFREQLLINDGTGNFSDQTAAQVSGNPAGADDNGVVCADIDNDGDFDAVVISLSTTERWLENDGTGNFVHVPGAFETPTDTSLWGEFGDLSGDGRFDFVTGQGEGIEIDRVYLANQGVPPDTQAPLIIGVQPVGEVGAGEDVVLSYAVSDRTVTDEGPRINEAYALLDPGGADQQIGATFMGGDLFRVVLPGAAEGQSVTFQVCAVDRQDNVGCSEEINYQVGEPTGGSTGGTTGEETTDGGTTDGGTTSADTTMGALDDTMGTSDTGDMSTSGAGSTTGAASTSGSTMTSATASASASAGSSSGQTATGTDDGGAVDGGGGGGCNCRQTTDPSPHGLLWLGFAGLLGLRRRRCS